MSLSQTSRTNRERWRRVEQIYVEAVERDGDARATLLEHACGNDAALRQDVESLLACQARAAQFIEGPALDVAAALLTNVSRVELVGRTIGPYVIEAWLGSGGMGDVYRARDCQLNRQVALKVLPDVFALDPDRLDRFKREAQVLASLNHPNIASIHGFEESDGLQALVLELIDGPTLAERIAHGPISIDEGLPIARQIAEALEAAHEQGIVHRDLKPANIAVRPDGTVKILDFGLAEVLQLDAAARGDRTPSATMQSPAAAPAAVILGTAAYMSPEQAKGRRADKRSDIWAFGAVLYEMLSGRRAFQGEGTSEVMAAVIAQELDLNALPVSTPGPVRSLVARCLERDPKRRLRDIGEARIVLDNPSATVVGGEARRVAAGSSWSWRRRIAVALLAIATATLAAFAAWQLKPAPPRGVTRFAFTLPDGQVFSRGIGRHSIALSRDGAQLVYSGVPAGLYLRAMSQLEATRIQGTEGFARVTEPAFSPDGQSIAFYTDRAVKRIAVTGGAAVTIAPADAPYGISWGDDGIVFGQGGKGILRVSPSGGTPETIVPINEGEEAHGPQILPGGQHVLFTLATGAASDRWDHARIVVQSLASGVRTTLVDGGSDARYLSTGHLVYALSGVLYAVPFDTQRLALTGAVVPIVEGVSRATGNQTGASHFSISATGTLVYIPGPVDASAGLGETMQLGLIDRNGVVERLSLPPDGYQMPRVSPDGTRIAFGTDDGKEAIVWIYVLFGNAPRRRLTFGGNNKFPVWSADGKRIVFQSDRDGDAAIFWQAADGSGTAERLTTPTKGTSHVPESWSPHGDRLLYSVETQADVALWMLSMQDRKATPFGEVHSTTPTAATFSSDGRWVAYASADRGKQTVYVQPFPATGAKYQLVAKELDMPSHPVWSPDGKELFYNPRPLGLEVVSVSTTPTFVFGDSAPVPRPFQLSPPEQRRAYDITPGGKFVARISATRTQYEAQTQRIQVVVNWFEELRERVPTTR
jgi:eukaryotic-like serine/threonine-protein kinase